MSVGAFARGLIPDAGESILQGRQVHSPIQSVPCVREDGTNHHLLVGMTDITNLACQALGTAVGVFSPSPKNRGH